PKKAVAIYKEFSKGKRDSDFMFTLSNHNFVSIDNINYFLRKAKKKLKIPKTISTHTFRHTHVSQLAELGVPLYIIQKRLGHSDSEITSKVYLHVTKKAQKKYDNIIESL
ncbi:tyrosine-type recombinase/integrase, partial [Limosilactobacillus reuteri subsp. suis]